MKIFNKNEWKKVKLEDVCSTCTSNLALKNLIYNSGKYPVYGASGLITYVDFYKRNEKYIGIVKDGAGVGRVMILPENSSVIGTMQYIIPNNNIDIKFLYYYLVKMNLSKYYSGSTIPHIYFKDYKNEKIYLPNKLLQNKIVSILDNISDVLEMKRKQLSFFEEFGKSLFIHFFGDLKNNKYNWDVKNLGELSLYLKRGITPKYVDISKIKIINQKCIYWKNFKEENCKFFDEDLFYKVKNNLIEKNDILINSTGTGTLGRCLKFKPHNNYYQYIVDSHVTILRFDKDKINPDYFTILFEFKDIQNLIYKNYVNGSTNQIELSTSKLKNFKMMVPPIELQNKFAQRIHVLEKLKFEFPPLVRNTKYLKEVA